MINQPKTNVTKEDVNKYLKYIFSELFMGSMLLMGEIGMVMGTEHDNNKFKKGSLADICKNVDVTNINSKLDKLWNAMMPYIDDLIIRLNYISEKNKKFMKLINDVAKDVSHFQYHMNSFNEYIATNLTKKKYGIDIESILEKYH